MRQAPTAEQQMQPPFDQFAELSTLDQPGFLALVREKHNDSGLQTSEAELASLAEGLHDVFDAWREVSPSIYDHAKDPSLVKSAWERSVGLSYETDNEVYYKREDERLVHSFKMLGSLNRMLRLTPEERERGVLCASAGNHAQGVAWAAQLLGVKATIVMPENTPDTKVDAVKKFGDEWVEIIQKGNNYSEASRHSDTLRRPTDGQQAPVYVHPFDDVDVINGQGIVALEMLEQHAQANPDRPLDYVVIPAGGGGLAAGMIKVLKALSPGTRIIIAEPADSDVIRRSALAGEVVDLPFRPGVIADGVAVSRPGEGTFDIIHRYADEYRIATEDAYCLEASNFRAETRDVIEFTAAVSPAVTRSLIRDHGLHDKTIGVIISGGNVDDQRIAYGYNMASKARSREALFEIRIPETKGSLQRLGESVLYGHNITQLDYDRAMSRRKSLFAKKLARVLVGFTLEGEQDKKHLIAKMEAQGFSFDDLSDDQLVRSDTGRQMFSSPKGKQKRTDVEVVLPNIPNALVGLLTDLSQTSGKQQDIGMFHFRSVILEDGRPIIGFRNAKQAQIVKYLAQIGHDEAVPVNWR